MEGKAVPVCCVCENEERHCHSKFSIHIMPYRNNAKTNNT